MISIPALQGIIDRRILVNYAADPAVVQSLIPFPFRPKQFRGKAIVGICLIRLTHIRPRGLPRWMGISSENGAHRIAVEWDEEGITREGVFIPRRDTSSVFNSMVGGRLFPGRHFLAKFDVREGEGKFHVAFKSSDETVISIDAQNAETFDPVSVFGTLENASRFFEGGALGYSPHGNTLQGMRLAIGGWEVSPLEVSSVRSSFFEDKALFPKGSVVFDHALLMTRIPHEWHSVASRKMR